MDETTDESYLPPDETPDDQRKRTSGVSPAAHRLLWLCAVFLIGIILGNLLWLFCSDVLAFGRTDRQVIFTVSETDSVKDIAQNLKSQGLVQYPWLFRLYAKVTKAENKIKSGTYTLQTRYDYHALVKALSAGTVQRSMFRPHQGEKEITWQNWNY